MQSVEATKLEEDWSWSEKWEGNELKWRSEEEKHAMNEQTASDADYWVRDEWEREKKGGLIGKGNGV